MATHQLTSLIKMANQIADNNAHVGDDHAVASAVADHIKKFWARSMKELIVTYMENTQQDSELNPHAINAIKQLSA